MSESIPEPQHRVLAVLWSFLRAQISPLGPPVLESSGESQIQLTWRKDPVYIEAEIDPAGELAWLVRDLKTGQYVADWTADGVPGELVRALRWLAESAR